MTRFFADSPIRLFTDSLTADSLISIFRGGAGMMEELKTLPLPETPELPGEERVTPDSSFPQPAPRIPRSAPAFLWVVAVVGVLLAALSLGVNIILIRELSYTRQEGQRIMDESIAALDQLTLDGMRVAYTFSDTIHYSGTVPISQTVDFPFQGNVPFRGEVPIVIDIPLLGAQTIRVPVDTSVYVNTVVRVPVRMDFPFNVTLPVQLPIEMEFSTEDFPALGDTLAVFYNLLQEFRTLFR